MARFIAIPVRAGDAFYLERDDISVLIDGGRDRRGFSSLFRESTDKAAVNILVCTHNDTDHTEGILGFLESGLTCDEVWLPGSWLDVLPDVLRPFLELFDTVKNEVAESISGTNLEDQQHDGFTIEDYAIERQVSTEEAFQHGEGESIGRDGWPGQAVPFLENAEPWDSIPESSWSVITSMVPLFSGKRCLSSYELNLVGSAINAATRIRSIAIEAFHRGIPVRWFEYNVSAPGLGLVGLRPLNARAVARVYPRRHLFLWRLALTTVNKESLVFWSPAGDNHPGVLFTADSDLTGVNLPTQIRNAIVTAPHHGSDANAKAYALIENAAKVDASSITWVRSDGRYRMRPGKVYRNLSARRACTMCLEGTDFSRKRAVRFFARIGKWNQHRATDLCKCS